MSRTERSVLLTILATGVASIVTQLTTVREFLSLFGGNELVIALILFTWLVLGGTGTLLARLALRRTAWLSTTGLAWLALLLVVLAPGYLLAARLGRGLFFTAGSSAGFYPAAAYIAAAIAPYTLLVGFLLPYSLFVLRRTSPSFAGARVYLQDTLGDAVGGALFAFWLVATVTPLQAVALASLPLWVCSALLPCASRRQGLARGLALVAVAGVLLAACLVEPWTLERSGVRPAAYRESRYGRLTVFRDREQVTLFRDGVPLFNSQNEALAEETVHYPLVQVADPRAVLLLSSAAGMLTHLARYTPGRIDYVEIDPAVTELQERFGLLGRAPGLHTFHQDGRAFLNARDDVYDAILVCLPEPDTFQTNRFYTTQFFALAARRLTPGGVLSFSLPGYDNYLSEPRRRQLSALYNTARRHFRHVLLLPGERIFFLCRQTPLHADISARLARRNIEAPYIRGFFDGNVTPQRITALNALMDPLAPVNADLAPRLMHLTFAQWFARFGTSPLPLAWTLAAAALLYLPRTTREEFVLFATGFTAMGCELLVIFTFQIFFGYIYFQIGLIVFVFLAGLLPGAWCGWKLSSGGRPLLAGLDLLLVLLPAALIAALSVFGARLPLPFFAVYGFVVSTACGCQLPVALALAGGGNPAVTRTFSADLIGAAAGALLTSLLLIPYLGIIGAAAGLIVLKLSSLWVIVHRHD